MTTNGSSECIAQARQSEACMKFIFSDDTSSEVQLRLLLHALKQQKVANFLRAESKPLVIEGLTLKRKIAVWVHENHFPLQ